MNAQFQLATDTARKQMPDYSTILAYVDAYCREHPEELVADAAAHLYRSLE